MFSHLCRVCLAQFNDPSDIVPLFEPHGNIYYYRICHELQLLVQKDDQLGSNICQTCSENIMKFYKFVVTYRESDRKLKEMRKNATVTVDELIEFKPNIAELEQRIHYSADFEETSNLIKSDVDSKEFVQVLSTALIPVPAVASRQSLSKALNSEAQVECSICKNKFESWKMLAKHKREQHWDTDITQRRTNANDEYECDICSKRFISKTKIKQHLATHINEGRRKFLCVACGNQFCSKFGLVQHISAIHDKEQKFQCTKCSRRFAHKHNLKTHMNRHNGIRPYVCNVCTKSFYDSSSLNVHTKSVHSGTNAYVCSICSKGFNRNGNLKIHMVKTHHIQRPKIQNSGNIQRVITKVQ